MGECQGIIGWGRIVDDGGIFYLYLSQKTGTAHDSPEVVRFENPYNACKSVTALGAVVSGLVHD